MALFSLISVCDHGDVVDNVASLCDATVHHLLGHWRSGGSWPPKSSISPTPQEIFSQ